ncbi:hypothetical protein [Pseudoduganella namucuonensis]|uniref:Uncharacterized protein n=1 Tax=Pseudoduganella namucuonensis TaxID=1035707 RepID=A0A1I7GRB9_9BURK|nr:hypothetical protein [Pseudoduganella namucuonensis]SFU50990.1 hypothetical protein SAMN05216552_100449 [Pseudoduganella namucuonensis]
MPIYVQHQVLGRIPDVFNAESIWQAPGLALFSRRPLLRDLLERSPREHRGRAATRCFSHVTLMLPQEEVDDDYHLTRGARARELAQTLAALHQKDFGDLLGNDQVRYDVLGKEELAPGEVEVRFGHAVYLPAPDEKALFNVCVSRDGAVWKPVCPIYPNQRLALIGGDDGMASYVASGWPFGADGAVLLLNDGPDAQPVVHMRPKDAFDCGFDANAGCYVIKSRRGGVDAQGAPARMMLKITRCSSAPASSARMATHTPGGRDTGGMGIPLAPQRAGVAPSAAPAVWQVRPRDSAGTDDATAVPQAASRAPATRGGETDATYVPLARQRVSLVALALPRLSRYRDTGASVLEIPFSRTLAIQSDPDAAGHAISFAVNAADELSVRTEAGEQRVTAPASFTPVDARAIRVLPAPRQMTERYCALLALPLPVAAPAGGARQSFGRRSAALAALRLLDSPRFLRCGGSGVHGGLTGDVNGGVDGCINGGVDAGHANKPASADRIGLSREAFSYEASPEGFRIARLAPTQALYHLDDQLRFVASVAEASVETPYLLPPGHHLVAGHYVLRFDV